MPVPNEPGDTPANRHLPVEPCRSSYDVVVVGGGPAGSTAAHLLARSGLSVLIAERSRFPRFHIGESLLPRNMPLLRDLGVTDRLASLPHTEKLGVEFALGHREDSQAFLFSDGLIDQETATFNVERAPFDATLLALAAEAGAEVVEGAPVRRLLRLDDGGADLVVGATEVSSRVLIDASGQATLVGKHLGIRRGLPDLRRVAFGRHFTGVERRPGSEAGHPAIVMMDDGWFWAIPLDQRRTSVGLVMERQTAVRAGVPWERMLDWGIARCPFLRRRMAAAEPLGELAVSADFSYRCSPFAGPGYFLVGDAATFLDPIFSTGVCLGMLSAAEAARSVTAMLLAGSDPVAERRRYQRFVERSTAPFFRLVRSYYEQPFREMLILGRGPLGVHRAILSLLAGFVFPRPPWAVRWRMRVFYAMLAVQRRLPLVPRLPAVRLLDGSAEA